MINPLETIYRDDSRWLFDRVRLKTGNHHTAEDVVGETFVELVQMRSLDDVREPRAMLLTIARRILFDIWRRRDLERAYLDQLALQPQAMAPSPEDRLEIVQALALADAALRGLPPKARQSFLMCQLRDMTYADIALAVGVSTSMVRQYIARGLSKMLSVLDRGRA